MAFSGDGLSFLVYPYFSFRTAFPVLKTQIFFWVDGAFLLVGYFIYFPFASLPTLWTTVIYSRDPLVKIWPLKALMCTC